MLIEELGKHHCEVVARKGLTFHHERYYQYRQLMDDISKEEAEHEQEYCRLK